MKHNLFSHTLLILSLLAAVLIYWVREFSYYYLGFLALLLGAAFLYRNLFSHRVVVIARILVGSLFIFSGFVKGVDPLGVQYILHDYMNAYNFNFMQWSALPASFFLNLLEFSVGVLLVFNIRMRVTVSIAAIMMVFFTSLTLYDAIANPVPDCGCFGKAIILTNWQTFYKNIVLDVFMIILCFSVVRLRQQYSPKKELIIFSSVVVLFLGFQYYNYKNLPCIDFLDWKVGKVLMPPKTQKVLYYSSYKNNETGEIKEFLSKDIPYSDTAFMAQWTHFENRVDDPNPPSVNITLETIQMYDGEEEREDVFSYWLSNPDFHFAIVAYDLDFTDESAITELKPLIQKCEEAFYSVVVLTASPYEKVEEFKRQHGLENIDFYYSDDTSLKGMIRANPGLMLFKESLLLGKWAPVNFPKFEDIDFENLAKKIESTK